MRLHEIINAASATVPPGTKSAIQTFFDWIGVNPRDLVAGFAGGVSNIIVFQRVGPWSATGSVILGMLASGWLLDLIMFEFNLSEKLRGPFGFIVGLCAMVICQGIVGAVTKWNVVRTIASKGAGGTPP